MLSDCINKLPNNDDLPKILIELQAYVKGIDTIHTSQEQLRGILDELQTQLGDFHNKIADNWFLTT